MSNYTKTTNFLVKDSLASGNAAKVVKGSEIDTVLASYREKASTYSQFIGLRNVVEANLIKMTESPDKILGGKAQFTTFMAKAATFAGFNPENLPDDFFNPSRAQYDADMQNVANQMVRQLLGESAKNISNIDRELANQVAGLLRGYLTDPAEVVQGKLRKMLGRIDLTIRDSDIAMKGFEETYLNQIVKGTGALENPQRIIDIIAKTKREMLGLDDDISKTGFFQSSSGESGAKRVIKYSDIVNPETGKIDREKLLKFI